jgi:hypothetical protein
MPRFFFSPRRLIWRQLTQFLLFCSFQTPQDLAALQRCVLLVLGHVQLIFNGLL